MDNPAEPSASSQSTPSSWPKIMGIIGLVVAILGILSVLLNAGYVIIMKLIGFERYFEITTAQMADDPAFIEMGGAKFINEMTPILTDLMETMFLPFLVLSVMILMLAVAFIIASFKLTKRRRKARLWMIVCAYSAIVFTILSTVLSHQINSKLFTQLASKIDSENLSSFANLSTISSIFGAIFAAVIPIFILIWFNRQKIKTEIAGESWN